MNKMILVTALALVFTSSAFAASETDVHASVNNSSATAHQLMIKKAEKNTIAAGTPPLNEHEKAAIIHNAMNNGHAQAHQDMAEQHKKMMGNNNAKTTTQAEPFTAMNEHEKAAMVHRNMNNGHSAAHQQAADEHLKQVD